MDQTVKERLVGMGVLLVLGVIFIPLILDGNTTDLETNTSQGLNLPVPSEGITHEMSFSDGNVRQLELPPQDNDKQTTIKPEVSKDKPSSVNTTSSSNNPDVNKIPASGFVDELPKDKKIETSSKNDSDSTQRIVQNSSQPQGTINRATTLVPDTKLQTSTALQSNAVVSSVTAWVVQIGSFSSRISAEKQVSELKSKGFPAFLRRYVTAENKVLFRVRVGPEKERARAEKLAERLLKAKIKGQIVSDP